MSPKLVLRLARFVIAGTTAAAANILILYLLVEFLHIHYLAASVMSFIASIGVGFTLQKFWTFRDHSTSMTHIQLGKYSMITTANLGINTLLMYTFVSILGMWYILAQICAGGVIAFTSYVGNSLFVFEKGD